MSFISNIALRRAALAALLAAFLCGGLAAQAAPRCCAVKPCEAAAPAENEQCCATGNAESAPEPTSNPCSCGLNSCCCQLNLDSVAQTTAPRVVSLDDLQVNAGFEHHTETYCVAPVLRSAPLPQRTAAAPPPTPATLGVFLC